MTLILKTDSVIADPTALTPSNPIWTPKTHPGAFVDLTSSAGTTIVNGVVSKAVDQISGYTFTASTDAGTAGPALAGAAANGRTPFALTGGGALALPSTGLGTHDAPWMMAMMRINAYSSSADEQLFFLDGSGTPNFAIATSSGNFAHQPIFNLGGGVSFADTVIPTGALALLTAFFDADNGGVCRWRINGADVALRGTIPTAPTGVQMRAGYIARYGNPINGMQDTSLFELILGGTQQHLADIQRLETTLANTYSTSAALLPADHPGHGKVARRTGYTAS